VKDSENQNTINLHADGNITCKTHVNILARHEEGIMVI
jgi:hypothetical protein